MAAVLLGHSHVGARLRSRVCWCSRAIQHATGCSFGVAVVGGSRHLAVGHSRLLASFRFTLSGSERMNNPRRKLRRANHRVRIEDEQPTPPQFSLRRLFGLVTMVAVVCSLFATVGWARGLLALAGINLVACIVFLSSNRRILAALAGVTTLLSLWAFMVGALRHAHGLTTSFEGWVASLAWVGFLQCVTLICWLFSGTSSAVNKK